jgi:2-polyprenyl-3-methyl-5-hydroxy-6-metoxy-1,4-benzoquinol methylase
MQNSRPDFRQRAQWAELMDNPCSREVLRACLKDIARSNRWTFAYWPLLRFLHTITTAERAWEGPLRILDVGCGYGDVLRRIERWAEQRHIDVELTGLDLNPDATVIAIEASRAETRIQWVTADVLRYAPERPPHLVLCSQFTHHLTEPQIVQFLEWMEMHAELGWFISDLSRAAVPYYFYRAFSKIMRLHSFVQHDGPVSIARSFVRADWQRMCSAAGLSERSFAIQSWKPARVCVARRKLRSGRNPQ